MFNENEDKKNRVINKLQTKKAHRDEYTLSTLEDRMKELNTSGVSLAVIDKSEIIWSQGFGVKEYGKNEKIDENSMFLAGSVSKPMFALVVMKLKEKGLLDLDTDVNEYLKGWKIPLVDGWQPRITLRQILSHTAGLTVPGFGGYLKSENIPTTIQILKGEKPANSPEVVVDILPGTKYRYSGGGYIIAQKVIEDILEKSLPQIMEEELFIPLNLSNSTYEQNLPNSRKNQIVTAHPFKNQPVVGQYHLYPEMAAAGLWTTANDLAQVLLEIEKAAKGESDFFKKETIDEMLTPQKIAKNIGIGFFLQGNGEDKRFYHNGCDEGFLTYLISYKNYSKAAVVMINSNEGFDLLNEITDAVAREFDWKNFIPEKLTEKYMKVEMLNRYVGIYKNESDTHIEIFVEDEKLFLKVDKQLPIPLKSKNKYEFYFNKLNTDVLFKFTKKNLVSKIIIIQNGEELTAKIATEQTG